MKNNKLKTKFTINIIKSILFALSIIAILCIVMIIASLSRAFAVFFNQNLVLFIALFTAIFISAFFYVFLRLVNKDIENINQISLALIEISKGNFRQNLNINASDEIGAMAETVNYMSERLDKLKEEERLLEQKRRDLITNISHDLRTPLTSVLGYLDLIINHKYDDQEALESYAKIAHSKCVDLKLLIDELFEYSRLANAEVPLKKQSVNLVELLEQVLVSFIVEFEKTNLTYSFNHPKDKVMVEIDPSLYKRVFENLLANAIAYADSNTNIEISIAKNDGNTEICFKNFNQQITDEECSHLFERNYRTQNDSRSGTGLGLSIVKQIVELHENTILVLRANKQIIFTITYKD